MKKRVICILLACACLLFGLHAFAANGSGDSLVSVSYLNGTFLASLRQLFQARASEDTQAVYDETLARLDALGNSYLSDAPSESAGNWSYSDTVQLQSLSRGDTVTLSSGSTVFLTVGTASAGAGLVDATEGSELAANGKLTANHRYLNGQEAASVTVTVLSDAAQLLVEGYWTVARSGEAATSFTDLVKTSWYYSAVSWAVSQGLFEGVNDTIFDPTGTTSRSMLATLLYRMEGRPSVTYAGTFSDVPNGRWFSAGIEWAASAGVVEGNGRGLFDPNAPVSREQIALMLYRYAGEHLGLDVSQRGDLTSRPDGSSVSRWAREGMAWAVGVGIITGADGNKLLPQADASRAEVATMLQRFWNWSGLS